MKGNKTELSFICICGENRTCAGCRKGGCGDREICRNYQCCSAKGLEGCWACGDFPCDAPMLTKPRVRAFAEYAAENGEERLLAGNVVNIGEDLLGQ